MSFNHFQTLEERFWAKVNKTPDCWLWTGALNDAGYGRITRPSDGRVIRAHRASWEIHRGPLDAMDIVCHVCDTPACVRPSHLVKADKAWNNADMYRKGRDRHHRKLTTEAVSAIRHLYQPRSRSTGARALARAFGISNQHVSDIVNRKKRNRE
jgi:hypothetical protein